MLADVAANRLGAERMIALQVYTRDLGRGLVMIGGPSSYGAGGYKRTPLEEALPVDMDVRDRDRQPDIALVVVIDQSGSMDACHCNTANRDNGVQIQGVPKVDIGKEAILRAVAALTERDEFGVVAFNENAHWAIHTAPLGQIGDVEAQIAGIRAGRPDQHLRRPVGGGGVARAGVGDAAPHRPLHRRLVEQRRVRRAASGA